jgi:hypothetical protein
MVHLNATTINHYYSFLLNFGTFEKFMAHQVHQRTGRGKNTNDIPSMPVDGKGLIQFAVSYLRPLVTLQIT